MTPLPYGSIKCVHCEGSTCQAVCKFSAQWRPLQSEKPQEKK